MQLKEPTDFAIMLNGEIRDPHFFRRRGDVDMYAKEVSVQNHVGLHARPATFFIQKANEFKSGIWVERMTAALMPRACWASCLWES